MNLYIRDPKQDNSVNYAGKTLPKDKKDPVQTVIDPNIDYAGKSLPKDTKEVIPQILDASNNPSLIILNGVTLPRDTAMYVNGEKVLAMSRILDGVSVIERISREPYEIEFEVTLRETNANGNVNVFPQTSINNLWNNIWIRDSVVTVQNTLLNNLFIQEVVIKDTSLTTVRGSTNVPIRIKCYENQPGESIIVTSV